MNTRRLLGWCGIAALAVTLGACEGVQMQGVDVGRLVKAGQSLAGSGSATPAEEQQLGERMAALVLGAGRLSKDAELQRYVNRVGTWVALQSDRPELPWSFGVIDSPNLNAFATPGGYVLVTSGLVRVLDNEAELAGVLAHEIAHIEEKHHLHAIEKGDTAALLGEVAIAAGSAYSRERGGSTAMQEELTGNLINATRELYTKGLSRGDEYAADRRGTALLARAGYDPFALAVVLQKLASVKADDSRLALLFATHPRPSERLDELSDSVASLEQQAASGELLAKRFKRVVR